MTQKTFINSEHSSKFNAATIGMLYTYWHEIAKDGILSLAIDEQKEIEELVSLLPPNLILDSISVQELFTNEFAYTYVFKRPCILNSPSKGALTKTLSKVNDFLNMVNNLTENAGYFYVTPIHGTNIVIGTFIIG